MYLWQGIVGFYEASYYDFEQTPKISDEVHYLKTTLQTNIKEYYTSVCYAHVYCLYAVSKKLKPKLKWIN